MMLAADSIPYIAPQEASTLVLEILVPGLVAIAACAVLVAKSRFQHKFPRELVTFTAVICLVLFWFASTLAANTAADASYHAKVLQAVKENWPVSDIRATRWAYIDDPKATGSFLASLKGESVECTVFNIQSDGLTLRCTPWVLVPTENPG